MTTGNSPRLSPDQELEDRAFIAELANELEGYDAERWSVSAVEASDLAAIAQRAFAELDAVRAERDALRRAGPDSD